MKAVVGALTQKAMRGEVDFRGALMERVALLGGLAEGVLAECRMERVRLTRGARTLVQTMKDYGAQSVLVTGGLAAFSGPTGGGTGSARVAAKELMFEGGEMRGTVGEREGG